MRYDTVRSNWRKWSIPNTQSKTEIQSGDVYWMLAPNMKSAAIQQRLDELDANGHAVIINRYADQWDHETMRARLNLWGVPVAQQAVWNHRAPLPNHDRYVRTVTCWVYGSDIVHMGLSTYSSARHMQLQPIQDWNKAPYRRLARIAMKTAYALGYDTLQVTMQAGGEYVADLELPAGIMDEPLQGDAVIHAAPITEETGHAIWRKYIARIKQFGLNHYRANSQYEKILYGMDCEFLLFDRMREKALNASHFLPLTGVAGCDAVRRNGRVIYPIMELRPLPAPSPRLLIEHLHHAMVEAKIYITSSKYRNKISWLGGAYPYGRLPIGCHLHLSGIPYDPEMIRTFDTYLALPLALLEPKLEGSRRRPMYGMFGDVRIQDHGGAGGFEYRTLPNFLYTPELALDITTLLALLTKHYRKLNRREATKSEWLHAFMNPAANHHYRRLAVELLEEVKHIAADVDMKLSVTRLIDLLAHDWTWDERADIRQNWLTPDK